jgi:hypothetical protein
MAKMKSKTYYIIQFGYSPFVVTAQDAKAAIKEKGVWVRYKFTFRIPLDEWNDSFEAELERRRKVYSDWEEQYYGTK